MLALPLSQSRPPQQWTSSYHSVFPRVHSQIQSGSPPQLRSVSQIWSLLAPKTKMATAIMPRLRLQSGSPQTTWLPPLFIIQSMTLILSLVLNPRGIFHSHFFCEGCTSCLHQRLVQSSSVSPPPPPFPAPVIMHRDGLMAYVLFLEHQRPPGIQSIQQQEGWDGERKGRGSVAAQWRTARQEDVHVSEREMFSLSLLLSFDRAAGRSKLFQHTEQVRR